MAQNTSTINRDEIIDIISNFYNFFTTHPFLPASSIKKPPSEGWPEEYREIWRKISRSEEVIDLLAHLPYIDDVNWLWFHETMPINYTSPLNLRRTNEFWERKRYLFEPPQQIFPPHMFLLTNGRLYGIWVLLDVQAGTITEFSFYDSSPVHRIRTSRMQVAQTGTSFPLKLLENCSKHVKKRWKEVLDPQDEGEPEKPGEEQLADIIYMGVVTL